MQSFEYQYNSDSAALRIIRQDLKALLQQAGFEKDELDSVIVAVNEACMNIVQHADNGHYDGCIDMRIMIDAARVSFEIEDNAEYVNLDSLTFTKKDKLSPGGLGLFFINEIMDDVVYSHKQASQGNRLLMTKVLNKHNEI
ncbi:MAG: ATP-binding protein [Gammaproteobacteria bacterium]|nr:ATP-binding protein [Gammaproteobacteria bacterium]